MISNDLLTRGRIVPIFIFPYCWKALVGRMSSPCTRFPNAPPYRNPPKHTADKTSRRHTKSNAKRRTRKRCAQKQLMGNQNMNHNNIILQFLRNLAVILTGSIGCTAIYITVVVHTTAKTEKPKNRRPAPTPTCVATIL